MNVRRANLAMLTKYGALLESREHPLPTDLVAVLSKGLVSWNDCVFLAGFIENLRAFIENDVHAVKQSDVEKMMDECFINHIHMEDYVVDHDKRMSVGLSLLEAISALTSREFPEYRFRGVIDESEIDSDSGHALSGNSVTVRFYRVRPGQEWLGEDIEDYKSSLVCEYDL